MSDLNQISFLLSVSSGPAADWATLDVRVIWVRVFDFVVHAGGKTIEVTSLPFNGQRDDLALLFGERGVVVPHVKRV